ncbi:MAG: phosphotransferase [Steroidobacteraceae bacterium]
MISLESIPSFTQAEALAAAKRDFGIVGEISALPSERDQNFLIVGGGGEKFVLKFANAHDTPELLDFQNQAMRRVQVSAPGCRVQRIVASLQGTDIVRIRRTGSSVDHCLRLLTWVDGEVLARCAARGPALFESIGANLADIDAALCGFAHPAMHRVLQWDLRRAGMAREHVRLLPKVKRTHVERLFSQWEAIDWSTLRHSVIHGDANDYNVIVGEGLMVGLLDFGDMVYSATVCDLAIALAYAMLGEDDPFAVAARLIRGYQSGYPLSEAERRSLFPLVLSRLAISVCYSAHNRARNPTDPYQVVSEAAAWDLLEKLDVWSGHDANGIWMAAISS